MISRTARCVFGVSCVALSIPSNEILRYTSATMNDITLPLTFAAGIISFLSPCILPIVPGFLAYLAGSSVSSVGATRRETFLNALFFVVGFSLVFAALGVLLQTVFSSVAYDARIWLSRVGGLIVLFFGLYLAKIISVPFLDRGHVFAVGQSPGRSRYVTSLLFGAAFAAGWTPCVGAVLGAILTLAVTQPGAAFALMLTYSLGLGLPFLLVGLFAASVQPLINRYAAVSRSITIAFGVVLVLLGILVFTQRLDRVANFEILNRIMYRQ